VALRNILLAERVLDVVVGEFPLRREHLYYDAPNRVADLRLVAASVLRGEGLSLTEVSEVMGAVWHQSIMRGLRKVDADPRLCGMVNVVRARLHATP